MKLDFNPHLPCGRRHRASAMADRTGYFNPHLPCGRRHLLPGDHRNDIIFQSTPSLRKATLSRFLTEAICCISIHTFLAEGDCNRTSRSSWESYFNPHLPCGRRPVLLSLSKIPSVFQSTPSLRKATTKLRHFHLYTIYFNPHLPCGRRPLTSLNNASIQCISIHTFLAEGDAMDLFGRSAKELFQSTPSLRKATGW